MGVRPLPSSDRTPHSPLVERLRSLKAESGLSVREIARRSEIPHSTVSEAMNGRRLPPQETVVAIVQACGGDVAEWRARWRQAAERIAEADKHDDDLVELVELGVDPGQVSTRAELVAALREMRGERSYSDVVSASGNLLSSSTLSDMLSGRTTPTWETLRAYLFACGQSPDGWNKALDRVRRERGTAAPVRRVPLSDCGPVQLGVHASGDNTKPLMYVPRDFDRDLKEALHDARERGGFILLVGASGTGKTRSLFEAMTRLLSDFALIHADAAPLGSVLPARTVVWFDDLDEHLNTRALDPAAINATLHGSAGPVVLLGTLRTEQYHRYCTLPTPDGPDPFSAQRALLKLARVIDVPAQLSHAELSRLRSETIHHGRAFDAVRIGEQQAIQMLTAAPHLLRRVHQAPGYAKAVIGAAVEADMSGAISAPQLYDAAARLMSAEDWAEAPPDWFDAALRYATARVHGGQSVLIALGLARARTERRYAVNDYVSEMVRRQWFDSRPDHEPELLPHPGEARRRAAPDAIEPFDSYERALSAGEHHLDSTRPPRPAELRGFVVFPGKRSQSPDIDRETMRLIGKVLARLEEEPQSPAQTLLIAYLAALALQVEEHGAEVSSRALFRVLRADPRHQP